MKQQNDISSLVKLITGKDIKQDNISEIIKKKQEEEIKENLESN